MTSPILAASKRTRRTPFSDKVEALGAKGYTVYNHMLLATAFNSVEEDYWHLREHVQVWDVSVERQVELSGPDAARLCQLMTPRNLSKAVVGQCVYAPITDDQGRMINDPVILKLAQDRYWISIADSDVFLFAKGLAIGMGLDVEIFEPDVWPVAVQGPKAEDLMVKIFGEDVRAIRFFRFERLAYKGHNFVVARSGWSKQGGFEIYVDDAEIGRQLWDELFDQGAEFNVGPGCPNLIERIEGGLFSYGNDFTIDHSPLECGLEKYCALDADIEFIGKEALIKERDTGIKRLIRGIKIDGDACPNCVSSWDITVNGLKIGKVSSAIWSPNLKANIGFAIINITHAETGTKITVSSPDGNRKATVCNIPFL